jgi:carboxylesterase type B
MAAWSLALVALLGAACAGAAADPSLVQTDKGLVQGVVNATGGYRFFKGIPFAASTAGANRFQPPQARAPWAQPLDATQLGPGCYQTHHNPDVPKNLSEDCLNLNVWTPYPNSSAALLPIMIFFHGGSFGEGSDQGPFDMYDGHHLAGTHQLCVATANYRLGALGFAVTDKLRGNFGIMDQNAALQWLQRNARSFGCDPARVTIWGESAGAMSVGVHVVSPRAKGLFHQAIMESNVAGFVYKTETEARGYGLTFCKLLQCTTGSALDEKCNTACIQNATVQAVGQAWDKAGNDVADIIIDNFPHYLDAVLDFTPTIDGDWLPDNPLVLLAANKYNPLDGILLGR